MQSNRYQLVAAVNDDQVLQDNLLRSRLVSDVPLNSVRGARSASQGFNKILETASGQYVIFAHQDVYLPEAWLAKMDDFIERIERVSGSNWAAIGVAGVNLDGEIVGQLWSEGIRREINAGQEIEEVVSLDEVLLVINTRTGIRFDSSFSGFHLYGTDIVQIAIDSGSKCYAVKNPIIHNDKTKYFLDATYKKAYQYFSRKWAKKLPILTTVTLIEKGYGGVYLRNLKQIKRYIFKRNPLRAIDPKKMAEQLGYE